MITLLDPNGFSCGSVGKESACNVGDLGLIPGLGRSPGEGKGYPLQYSGLENSMDCIVHGVAKSWTQLSDFHFPWTLSYSLWIQRFLSLDFSAWGANSLGQSFSNFKVCMKYVSHLAVFDSLWLPGLYPTRLLCPWEFCRQAWEEYAMVSKLPLVCLRISYWDGVGWKSSHSVVSDSLRPHGQYSPWNSPGQNTAVGRLSLLQGTFPTQGSNQGLTHCRWILYQLSHKGSLI